MIGVKWAVSAFCLILLLRFLASLPKPAPSRMHSHSRSLTLFDVVMVHLLPINEVPCLYPTARERPMSMLMYSQIVL
jgi:hypothetical protein